jgi:hypothetical protein
MLRNELDRNGTNIYSTTRRRRGDLLRSNGMLRNEFGRNVDFGVCALDRFTALHDVSVATICGVTAGTFAQRSIPPKWTRKYHGFAA